MMRLTWSLMIFAVLGGSLFWTAPTGDDATTDAGDLGMATTMSDGTPPPPPPT